MKNNIYLDNNATTAMAPAVIDSMVDILKYHYGNPSSYHAAGQYARAVVDRSRRTIASFLKVPHQHILFTSSATEALNLIIRGIVAHSGRGHIITSAVEHAAVYNTVTDLVRDGSTATFLPVDSSGAIDLDALKGSLQRDTRLIALMSVNNETGVKSDINAIAAIAAEASVPFVCDGVAQFGKELFTLPADIAAYCFTAHKIHGPKGAAAVYLDPKLKWRTSLTGGHQEGGRRSGTENVAAIAGFATAVQLLQSEGLQAIEHVKALRDKFEAQLKEQLPDIIVNGGQSCRIGNTSSITFPDVDGESLLIALDMASIAASHGSACAAGALEPSRVLMNMGLTPRVAASALRFSFGRFNTSADVDAAVAALRDQRDQRNVSVVTDIPLVP